MITPAYITGEMSLDFEEALHLGADVGISTVHLRMGLFGKNIERLGDEDIEPIKAALTRHDMSVGMLLPPFGKCDIEDGDSVQQHHDLLARTIEIAHAFDTRLIRAFPFRRAGAEQWEPSKLEEYFDRIIENFAPAVSRAESEGVMLCVEGISSTLGRTAEDTRRVINAFNSPAVAAIWEIDSGWRLGEPPSLGYTHLRGRIQDIHIKPNDAGNLDPIGDTGESFESLFGILKDDGYEGFVTIEHWPGAEGTLKGLQQLRAALDRAGA